MKRQRSSNIEGAAALLKEVGKDEGKTKVKRAVEEAKENDGKSDINGNGGGEVALENCCEELEWSSGGGAVDELMPWGCFWSPFWDVDYVDLASGEFFSDVWDDDIWNLKTIVEIPKPLEQAGR
ncbi:Ribulose bisphosphate carboxylase small chain 1A [Hibiscus syriacus]|uniref:Ribulose bisphosphate carboxylase small chain 1A n=1 Tax=Hibiscus syriacus TaxID=106335 RepID=A0A6A2Z5C2_HIBSY|nr:Ribulose bisphosphate carboxylase small chain 1A [Hibiscus syriacus]